MFLDAPFAPLQGAFCTFIGPAPFAFCTWGVILASTGRSGFLFRRVMLGCVGVDDTSQGVSLLSLVLLASDRRGGLSFLLFF